MTPLIVNASRVFHLVNYLTLNEEAALGNRTRLLDGTPVGIEMIVDLYGSDGATFTFPQVAWLKDGRSLPRTDAVITNEFRDEGPSDPNYYSNFVSTLDYPNFSTAEDAGLYFCLFTGIVTVDILFGFPFRIDGGELAINYHRCA